MMRRRPHRAGFTLAEILVSVMIFTVVGLAMTMTLYTATNLFRGGEQARAAGDEATAVVAALRADLARVVPRHVDGNQAAKDGGWIHATVDAAGDCTLWMVIENPDPMTVKRDGSNARINVRWSVDAASRELRRAEFAWSAAGGSRSGAPVLEQSMTSGCLHFGVWLELSDKVIHRPLTSTGPDWMAKASDGESIVPPWRSEAYNSDDAPAGQLVPFPAALRISLVLTGGGRHITRGTLISDNTDTLRVGGIRSLPTVAGALLRVGDEWIAYEAFTSGLVRVAQDGRGALRSVTKAHDRATEVLAGQFYALVHPLPR